jgi:hypothetical protein
MTRLHQNSWGFVDKQRHFSQTKLMEQARLDSSATAAKSANWRANKAKQGQLTFRVQLPRPLNEQIKKLQARHKIKSLGDVLDQIVKLAADNSQPMQLEMPPVIPKTEPVHDITTIMSKQSLDYLTRIKNELGLPRAKAIHAILITFPDALERSEATALQPNFNFNGEEKLTGK